MKFYIERGFLLAHGSWLIIAPACQQHQASLPLLLDYLPSALFALLQLSSPTNMLYYEDKMEQALQNPDSIADPFTFRILEE